MIMKKNTERETEQISAWIRERKWEHTIHLNSSQNAEQQDQIGKDDE